MPDNKRQGSNDLAANLKTVEEAGNLPDDAVEIAADDQGATALAQKIDQIDHDDGSPQR